MFTLGRCKMIPELILCVIVVESVSPHSFYNNLNLFKNQRRFLILNKKIIKIKNEEFLLLKNVNNAKD